MTTTTAAREHQRDRRRSLLLFLLAPGAAFVVAVGFLLALAVWEIWVEPSAHRTSTLSATLRDPDFWWTLERTALFAALVVPLKWALALPLARIIRTAPEKLRWAFILPWVIPPGVATLAWFWLFYDVGGGANLVLAKFGVESRAWLGTPRSAFFICAALNVWREVPLWATAMAPSISGFGGPLEHMAKLDGLSQRERRRLLVRPRLAPLFWALCLLSLIWSIGEFETVWLLTRGGPGNATEFLSVYAFRHAFLSQILGRGAAAYLVALPFVAVSIVAVLTMYSSAVERART